MSSPLDPTASTPEEARRLAETQRQLDEITRRLRAEGIDVEATAGFLPDDQAYVDEIATNEAAVFVRARAFTLEQIKGTPLPVLPCAEIDGLDWLRRAVIGGRVTCDYYGLADEIHPPGGGEPIPMPLSVVFRLVTRGQPTPIYVDIDHAPEDWKAEAMKQVAVVWPALEDGRRPYIATGPMKRFAKPLVIYPDMKVGRNEPCPCGSGKKSKRCCFA